MENCKNVYNAFILVWIFNETVMPWTLRLTQSHLDKNTIDKSAFHLYHWLVKTTKPQHFFLLPYTIEKMESTPVRHRLSFLSFQMFYSTMNTKGLISYNF